MKKRGFILTLLAMAMTLCLTTSCNKTEKIIIGTWMANNTEAFDLEEGEELMLDSSLWIFNDNMTCTLINNEGDTLNGSYIVNDDHVTLTFTNAVEDYETINIIDLDVTQNSKKELLVEGTIDMSIKERGRVLFTDSTKFKTTLYKR